MRSLENGLLEEKAARTKMEVELADLKKLMKLHVADQPEKQADQPELTGLTQVGLLGWGRRNSKKRVVRPFPHVGVHVA